MTKEREVLNGYGSLCDLGSDLAVLILHPWGLLGGNRNNAVVCTVASYFQRGHKFTTLRMDFQGYQIGWGYSELKQVQEASKCILEETAASKILIVGYSYGSIVGASAASDITECVGYIMIAPPFAVSHWLFLFRSSYHLNRAKESTCRNLLLIGTKDNFTTTEYFQDQANEFQQEKTVTKLIDDADHFFVGFEIEIIKHIDEWVRTKILCNMQVTERK